MFGVRVKGKSKLIQQQCLGKGLTFVGIQEARTGGPLQRSTDFYHIMTSGCERNAPIGVELWIRRTIPYGDKGLEHVISASQI